MVRPPASFFNRGTVMKKTMLDRMEQRLGSPVYVFRKQPGGFYCDKVEIVDGKKTNRTRYILTAGQSCTCLGFIKAENCKHLKMLADDPDWIRTGVPQSVAASVMQDLTGSDSGIIPEGTPDSVKTITLDVPIIRPEYVKMIGRKLFDGNDLGIILVFS